MFPLGTKIRKATSPAIRLWSRMAAWKTISLIAWLITWPITDRKSSPIHRSLRNDSKRSEEHTSELQSLTNLVCRLLLEKKKRKTKKKRQSKKQEEKQNKRTIRENTTL